MSKSYTIAEARCNLPSIVHELARKSAIQLTRRGRTVAVLLSIDEYERLQAGLTTFWNAYQSFRATVDLTALDIDPSIFNEARDRSPGREITL